MQNFKQALEKADRILITSHTNCDQDGITSALATKLIIQKNLPEKEVSVNIESELQNNISFLKSFKDIETEKLTEKIESFKPNLIIFTDGQLYERFTSEYALLEKIIKKKQMPIAIIDHHAGPTNFQTEYHFNNLRSSCAEEVYFLFVQNLNFAIDKDIAEIIMTGMIFDTGVFTYKNLHFRETANIVADLVEYGVIIEDILLHKNECTLTDLKIIAELSANLNMKNNFCYTYTSDTFFNNYIKSGEISEEQFIKGRHIWTNTFMKNIKNCNWGFMIYQTSEPGKYRVTLRSRQDGVVVREFAEKFGGGGHDYAAGFSIKAKDVKVATERVLEAI